MPKIVSYKTATPYLQDFIIGSDRLNENVTRNYKVSTIVDTILAALNIGTVTSISTSNSSFITGSTINNGLVAPITTTGSLLFSISATGTTNSTTFLRGDGTWALPGPTPTDISVSSSGNILTTDVDSINYTGAGITASSFNNNVTLNVPGAGSTVDSLIAGAGISVNSPTGNITVTNSGVFLARAGGNVTLSGGTGAVTISTVKNAGTVTSIAAGVGIDTITNTASNPEINIDLTNNNNYINSVPASDVLNLNDNVAYQQLTSNSVQTTRLRDIPSSILTQVKSYVDNADKNKISNNEAISFKDVAKAKQIVSITIAEYNQLNPKNSNTLYFIVGVGTSYTTNLIRNTTNITGGGSYNLNTTINGVNGTSITGPVGTSYTFITTITGSGSTVTNSNMPFSTSGTIQLNGNTETQNLSATVTTNVVPSVQARLVSIGLAGNLQDTGAQGTVWDYDVNRDRPNGASIAPTPAATGNPTAIFNYSFNPRIKLNNTFTYYWTAGADSANPEYLETGYGGVSWSSSWMQGQVSSTTPNNIVDVTSASHTITGSWDYVDYTAVAAINDNTTVSPAGSPASGISWSIQSNSPDTTYGDTITGLHNSDNFSWNQPTTSLPGSGYYTWATGSPSFEDANGAAITFPYGGTIANANGAVQIYVTGTLNYNAGPAMQYRKLSVTSYLQNNITDNGSAFTAPNYTITDGEQGPFNATGGNLVYDTPVIAAKTGYVLTNGTVTLPNTTVTYNVTPWSPNNTSQNGNGLAQATPAIENDPTAPSSGSKAIINYANYIGQISNSTPNRAYCSVYTVINNSNYTTINVAYHDCASDAAASITLPPNSQQVGLTSRTLPISNYPSITTITFTGYSVSGPLTWYNCVFSNTDGITSGTLSAAGPPTGTQQNTSIRLGTGVITATCSRFASAAGGVGADVVYPGRTATLTWLRNGNLDTGGVGNNPRSIGSGNTVSGETYTYNNVVDSDTLTFSVIEQ